MGDFQGSLDTDITNPPGPGTNVIVTLTAPFTMTLGTASLDDASIFLLLGDSVKADVRIVIPKPSLLLGQGRILSVGSVFPIVTTFQPTVIAGSNFISVTKLLAATTQERSSLDNNFILTTEDRTSFYEVFDRVRSEVWNTNSVPEAYRKAWSSTVVETLSPKNARNMISSINNRYAIGTRKTNPRRVSNNKYITNL